MGKGLKKARKAIRKRLKKRAKDKAPALAAILRRLDHIEEYLGEELLEFCRRANDEPVKPAAATVGTG